MAGLDGLLTICPSHVAVRHAVHCSFHSVLASCPLPAQRLWSFPHRKEQRSLSFPAPHLDQSLRCTLWFFSSSALRPFPSEPRAFWEQCSICVLTVTACRPETLSQTPPLSHKGRIAHFTCDNPRLVSPNPPQSQVPLPDLFPKLIPSSFATLIPILIQDGLYPPSIPPTELTITH